MDVINIILTLAATFNFSLGFYIYLQQKRNPVNISFSLITLSNFFWIIGMIAFRWAESAIAALWWCRILYFFPVFIAVNFLYFSFVFQNRENRLTRQQTLKLYLPAFIVAILVFIPRFVIESTTFQPQAEKTILFGPGYIIYFAYYFIYFSWAFLNLFFHLNKAKFLVRSQIRWVILGTFLPVSFGLVTNLILPWGYIFNLNWFAQIGSIIFIGVIAYAIVKYQLLNIKLIVAQILSLFLISILFLNIFYFDNFLRLTLNLAVFILGLIFSGTLIRSVIGEIEQREKIQKLAGDLEKANQNLKRLDEAKSEFISIASHQLRTPLSAIKGYTAMLLEEIKDASSKEALDKIYLSNERLIKLVNDLLNLSRIEQGKMQFVFKEIQLADVLDSIVNEFQVVAKKRGLKLIYEKVNLPLLKLDEDKIRQIFVNLIDNAIKYTLQGEIVLKTFLDEDSVTIATKDTGVGMKKEDLDSMYQKFKRGSSGLEVNPTGTGIGLYIAQKITEAHQGSIWAESEGINKGSTFYVKLPLP